MIPSAKTAKENMMTRWPGPYQVNTCYDNGVGKIITIDEDRMLLLVNGNNLRLYRKPLTKEIYTTSLQQDINLIGVSQASNK